MFILHNQIVLKYIFLSPNSIKRPLLAEHCKLHHCFCYSCASSPSSHWLVLLITCLDSGRRLFLHHVTNDRSSVDSVRRKEIIKGLHFELNIYAYGVVWYL